MSGDHTKARPDAPDGFFACEAAGLAWLSVAGGPRVVEVRDVGAGHLTLERVASTPPTPAAARELGRRLAVLHDTGAPGWGVAPPEWDGDAFFGPLEDPLPMVTGAWPDWPTFYAEARLLPVAEQGLARGSLTRDDADLLRDLGDRLDVLARPMLDDAPARLHGDLWSGNVMWSSLDGAPGVEAVLIDPAAHGGHRESDLAMLALFGAPHLEQTLAGYAEVHPLARGWRHRVALHQVYPVAVHAVLFGGGYVRQLRSSVAGLLTHG
ncbi:fructosamine kinase family protein [Cellulosimicrobium arenosum]|uniref:Fructosamine kinase family protein n=1 Tax=Cellulosimicrobium arenosum TaxID=2708133 RepID=A0A927IWG6_9MICO|nr:fructosamine kinase family protein [Cellulosimicrobium arenosum]